MPQAKDINALSDYSLINVLNAAVNGIIVLDAQSQIVLWNHWMTDASGFSEDDVIGKNLFQLYPEQQNKRLERAARNALKDGSSTLLSQALNRFPLVLKNIHTGEEIKQMIYVNPIDTESNARFCLIQINDVTAAIKREQLLRKTATEAQKAKEQAENLSLLKSGFVSTVSHELRTPLTSIMGSLGLISSGSLGEISEQIQPLVEIAHKNSERLLYLINDILDIEKIESGRMEFSFKPVQISELIQQSIEANDGYAKKYNVSFVIPHSESGLEINGDFERLMQVMNNLMSNAAKFSNPGDNIEVTYTKEQQQVKITVRDFGPGIAENFHISLFDKFTQADMSDTKQKGGTGLGLSIAKVIIEKHGGSIDFETEVGSGTTFYFYLPLLT